MIKDVASGWVVYGGIIGGILTAIIFCKVKKLEFLRYLDISLPAVAMAQGFGRIGCFFSGCCYGMESSFGFVVHGNDLIPEINDVRRLPVPLIEAACNLVIFFLLLRLFVKGKENGKVIFYYMLIYPVVRFTLEFFRGDAIRGFLFGLSTSQWISIGLFVVAVWKLFLSRKTGKKTAVCAGMLLALTLAFGGMSVEAHATEADVQETAQSLILSADSTEEQPEETKDVEDTSQAGETSVTTTGPQEKEPPFNSKEKFVIFVCCLFSVSLCIVIALFGNPNDRLKDKYRRARKQQIQQEKRLKEKAEREARHAAAEAKYQEELAQYEADMKAYEEEKAAKAAAKAAKKAEKEAKKKN